MAATVAPKVEPAIAVNDAALLMTGTCRGEPRTILKGVATLCPDALLAVTITLNVPSTDGVPERSPLATVRLIPVGNESGMAYDVAAGLAVNWNENGSAFRPRASARLVITGAFGFGAIYMLSNDQSPGPVVFVARTCTVTDPGTKGVPESVPVEGFIPNHAGPLWMAKDRGVLLAVS